MCTHFIGKVLKESTYAYSDEQLLYEAGALVRDGSGYAFNNAGYLFFASNPQRQLSWAYVRLLRFEAADQAELKRGLPTYEGKFDGPIAQQILKMRAFFTESGFFKIYQKRNPTGGFIDDPEFPHIAVDEAIVNAVAHRDYGIQLPVECIHYKNAFVVRNPGRILQRDQDLPPRFSLDTTILSSMPRNSKLIEWLKMMRDDRGAAFVRALSEGTKQMRDVMAAAGLPAPLYETGLSHTTVILYNNATEREAQLRLASASATATEFTNLFPVSLITESGEKVELEVMRSRFKDFMAFLKDALQSKGWFVDNFRFGRITAHRRGDPFDIPQDAQRFIQLYPAYAMQLREYWGQLYLCIDYTLEVKNIQTIRKVLTHLQPSELIGKTAVAQRKGWERGKVLSVDPESTRMYLFDLGTEEIVSSGKVIPDLTFDSINRLMSQQNVSFDLSREIKRLSLSLEAGSARTRAERTVATAEDISDLVFPLVIGGLRAILNTAPEPLYRDNAAGELQVRTLNEPSVEFRQHRESVDIRQGITSFGAYEEARKTIELVPICVSDMRDNMASLIERLKVGKFRYGGSERTFSTRFKYNMIITVPSLDRLISECKRLLDENPDWAGNAKLDRLFLVHVPEKGYSLDDERSPYYQVKRFLFEQGIPCQMVDTPTLLNPDWKDLNLALNIVAKCGITPWVLPNRIPDADFFIGLSYTQSRVRGAKRLLGYATVFNEFGNWEFYTGNTDVFSYEERTKYFASLTRQTLERLSLSDSPSIYFHYSARFSRDDREAILTAARTIRPNGVYSFVSINPHHNIRLYDSRAETDGSLRRGSYVVTRPNQILLSTTGYNPFRRSLGTPKPLEATIWIDRPPSMARSKPDLRSLAVQILSLTKLNWASTDSISAEPITTKYAGDIAYLTDAFLRQADTFRLHPVLEPTPWFI